MQVWFKIYWEFYQGIICITNEKHHFKWAIYQPYHGRTKLYVAPLWLLLLSATYLIQKQQIPIV